MKRSYTKIRFEKEAKDNSEMACSNLHCFYITALRDWFKNNSRQFAIQSEVKPELIATRSNLFSRASRQLHVFRSYFNWSIGFNFTTLNCKTLISILRPTVGINPSLLVVPKVLDT